jgi:hypothetical protein
MNLKIFRNYTEKRLGLDEANSNVDSGLNFRNFLKEIKIDAIKFNTEKYLSNMYPNDSKVLNKSIEIEEGFNFQKFEYEKDDTKEEKVYEIRNLSVK